MRPIIAAAILLLAWVSPLAMRAEAAGASPPSPTPLVTAFNMAYRTSDPAGLRPFLAQDIVWIYHAPEREVSFGGTRAGFGGVSDFFALRGRELSDNEWRTGDVVTTGGVVTIFGTERAAVKRTGGRYATRNAVVLTVREGKIERVEEFVDSSAIVDGFSAADPLRGRAIFTPCSGCHGDEAQGRSTVHAPNLTGLSPDYIVRQLRNFRSGRRDVNDIYGDQMIGEARAIPGDRGLRDVAAYIGSLPEYRPPHTPPPSETAKNGAALYATCAACHGADGSGNAALKAPPLRQAYPWYIARQLRDFRNGTRGTSPGDVQGALMRNVALAIPTETAVDTLAAYISALPAPPR